MGYLKTFPGTIYDWSIARQPDLRIIVRGYLTMRDPIQINKACPPKRAKIKEEEVVKKVVPVSIPKSKPLIY